MENDYLFRFFQTSSTGETKRSISIEPYTDSLRVLIYSLEGVEVFLGQLTVGQTTRHFTDRYTHPFSNLSPQATTGTELLS